MNIRLLLVAALFGVAPFASAQDPAPRPAAGEVALVTGSVTVAVPGEPRRSLKTGDKVREGQAISVGANSYASLKFADGGRVLLRPNSEFTVEQYQYVPPAITATGSAPDAPSSAAGVAFFRLVRGGFRRSEEHTSELSHVEISYA